jgi:hypothetical protein
MLSLPQTPAAENLLPNQLEQYTAQALIANRDMLDVFEGILRSHAEVSIKISGKTWCRLLSAVRRLKRNCRSLEAIQRQNKNQYKVHRKILGQNEQVKMVNQFNLKEMVNGHTSELNSLINVWNDECKKIADAVRNDEFKKFADDSYSWDLPF